MLRIFQDDGDEFAHVANDLRTVIRSCMKTWQPELAKKNCKVSCDLSASMPVLCQAEDTLPLLQGMFELTVNRCAAGGELSIVGCRAANVVELEIADSGNALSCEPRYELRVFPPKSVVNDRQLIVLQNLAVNFGGRIWATPCPQGGMAWTLRLPGRVANKRAA